MGRRRQARELALQFLYGFDLNRRDLDQALNEFWGGHPVPRGCEDFARDLIVGTLSKVNFLDEVIEKHVTNWRLSRIARVDKNILRIALYELFYRDDIPPLVSINEAVDLAKKFSTDQSGGFVNGILDQIRRERGGLQEGQKSQECRDSQDGQGK